MGQNEKEIHKRSLWPYFWPLLIFTSLLVGALTYNNYRQFRDNYYRSLLTDAEKRIEVLETFLRNEMIEAYRDLTFFKSNPINAYYINNELGPLDRRIFEKTMVRYGEIREAYQQIRLIDTLGIEKLKILFGADSTSVNSFLQNKSTQYYFSGLKLTQEHELYFSRFDLNMEGGKVVQPLTPVLRLGAPLYSEGKRQGYIVHNYKGERILDYFDVIESDDLFEAYLIDATGNWIKGPPDVEPYDYVLNPYESRKYSEDHPKLWTMINRSDSSRVVSPTDLMVFERLELLNYFGSEVSAEKTSTHWTLAIRADEEIVKGVFIIRAECSNYSKCPDFDEHFWINPVWRFS